METNVRIAKLKEIRETAESYARKDIYYKNKNETMEVFQIPLDCLIFNLHNGRIATFVKTHEKEHGRIDAETEQGGKLIADFLWKSKVDRNKHTQEDIRQKGQLEYGIVTADGVVIDGNRRFMLLAKNAEENSDATEYFKAVILPDTLASNQKEIMRLETTYQMGVDDKVDYTSIQKYLKCRDLEDEEFSKKQIAKMMGETAQDIADYLKALVLIDEYLEYYGYAGMYRVLEEKGLEAQCLELNSCLSRYKNGRKLQGLDWIPKRADIDDVKNVCFDYMRAGFGVRDIRIIATPAKNKGFFTQKDIWHGFVAEHFDNVDSIKQDELHLDEWRQKNAGMSSVDIISARDKKFAKQAGSVLKENLGRKTRDLEDSKAKSEPLVLLKRAKKTMETIDTDVDGFKCDEVRKISHEIRKIAETFIKIVDKG